MPVKPSKKLAIVQRRRQVSELYLKGWSQPAIAEELIVSQPTICEDLKQIRLQWKESAVRDYDLAREIELRKLDQLEREAWAAWERSQQPLHSAVITGQSGQQQERRSMKNQHGDPRFLEVVHKCIVQRRAILGLDTPPLLEIPTNDDLAPAVRRDRLITFIATLRERCGTETTRTGPGSGQPRLPGTLDQPGEMDAG